MKILVRYIVILSNRPHFPCTFYGFTGVITHGEVGRTREHESILPTSKVGYHAGKPLESVVYCFYKQFFMS